MAPYGWTGKLLLVDLSARKTSEIDTMAYVPRFVGGLGVAASLAWNMLSPGVDAFAPESPLMIMTGPLTGTLASGAGRVEVCGVAPQQNPSIHSRSGMGGHWGAELKFAGWDGVVIVGQADSPCYLWINDAEASLLPADDLWGRGVYGATRALRARHGKKCRVVAIGPAGERLSRIASLHTETGNAAGQGGYGGLMGSKRLKAIVTRGTGGVRLAHPHEFMRLVLSASREGFTPAQRRLNPIATPGSRRRKCGFCATPCAHPFAMSQNLRPGETNSGVALHCYGFGTTSPQDNSARMLATDLGLNGWEVSYGIIPWLQMCKQEGLIDAIDGMDIPVPKVPIHHQYQAAPVSVEFAQMLLNKIAFRQGVLGDALAEGCCRAAQVLFDGRGEPLLDAIYPRRAGQTSHWAGHWGPGGICKFPYWLMPVLQWCVDTRDPASDSTHSWTTHAQFFLKDDGPLPRDVVRDVARRLYGVDKVGIESGGYEPAGASTAPAIWHHLRGMLIDSLILCDYEHARVFSMESEDGMADTAIMAKLFSAATGEETSEQELDQAAMRIWQLHRAIDVRYFRRTRAVDESSLNAYMLPGKDDGVVLNRAAFLSLLDDYYRRVGWDRETGWPRAETLDGAGLHEVADALY